MGQYPDGARFSLETALPSRNLLGAKGSAPSSGDLCDIYPSGIVGGLNQTWMWACAGTALAVAGAAGLLLGVSQSRPRFDDGAGGYQIDVAPPPPGGRPEPWQLWDCLNISRPADPPRYVLASHWTPDGRRWVLGVKHGLDWPTQPAELNPAPAGPGSWEQRPYPPQQLWWIATPIDG